MRDGYNDDELWLEVAPEHMTGFTKDVVEKIRDACNEVESVRTTASGSQVPVRFCPKSVPTGRTTFGSS